VNRSQQVHIYIPDSEANLAALARSLRALDVECRLQSGNGQSPRLVVTIGPEDDGRLLALWEQLTDLRVRYLEGRQAMIVEQLSFLEASGEAVIL